MWGFKQKTDTDIFRCCHKSFPLVPQDQKSDKGIERTIMKPHKIGIIVAISLAAVLISLSAKAQHDSWDY
jgi:hypothetical protein